MARKWSSTKNHWAYTAERQEILKRISKGWGRKPVTRVTLTCPQCGSKFEVKKSEKNRRKYCSKECLSRSKKGKIPENIKIAQAKSPFQKGEKNINWKGGITPYPKEWTGSLHHRVWIRDQNKCQLCGKGGKKRSDLVCHHLDFDKQNCLMDNLQLLCRSCHMKIHWKSNKGVPGLKNYNRDSS